VTEQYAEWFSARLREALGSMTQAELLKILAENGVKLAQQRLSHYMQGRNYPDPPILKELARALGVSADWLLGLTEESLPVADLEEMVARAKGEGRINRIMSALKAERQQEVMRFAEYLLARQREQEAQASPMTQRQREQAEIMAMLDSIEREHGRAMRLKIEKSLRVNGIPVDSGS
jgi:transcriptional regulator with XRE-family HTH domain